jgi:GNAT superfamily N-acetyltransferase
MSIHDAEISTHPLTPECWDDFVTLFGPNGACEGCWCMFWRLRGKEFQDQTSKSNQALMKALVDSGVEPGLLAYIAGRPAGWVALAPRADYQRLAFSRNLRPVDDQPVWSLPCLFIDREFRRKGLTRNLIQAACEYARQHGAKLLEVYPKEPGQKRIPAADAYTGVVSIFEEAGFREVARHVPNRPIMRLELKHD